LPVLHILLLHDDSATAPVLELRPAALRSELAYRALRVLDSREYGALPPWQQSLRQTPGPWIVKIVVLQSVVISQSTAAMGAIAQQSSPQRTISAKAMKERDMSSLATSMGQVVGHGEVASFVHGMAFGTLTASIAHEVSQPLSGIMINASNCLRMLAADPPNVNDAL
jgi:signal transduction histidine kinase